MYNFVLGVYYLLDAGYLPGTRHSLLCIHVCAHKVHDDSKSYDT